jgi:hypothetical protein
VVGAVAAEVVAVGAAVVGSCVVCRLCVRSRCFFDGLREHIESVFDVCHAVFYFVDCFDVFDNIIEVS